MCGCAGGNRNRQTRIRITAVRPRNMNATVANPASFQATPNTPTENEKRIQKLRRDAIRKALGK